MKKSLFIQKIIVAGLILSPAVCLGSTATTDCDFSNPTIIRGDAISGDAEYQALNCTTTYSETIATTSDYIYTIPYASFFATSSASGTTAGLVDQSWSYGELFISFLGVFFLCYTILKDILRFFFPETFKILRNDKAL